MSSASAIIAGCHSEAERGLRDQAHSHDIGRPYVSSTSVSHVPDTGTKRGVIENCWSIVSQTNIRTVSKVPLGKRLRDGVECIIMGVFRAHRYRTELN